MDVILARLGDVLKGFTARRKKSTQPKYRFIGERSVCDDNLSYLDTVDFLVLYNNANENQKEALRGLTEECWNERPNPSGTSFNDFWNGKLVEIKVDSIPKGVTARTLTDSGKLPQRHFVFPRNPPWN